MIPKYLYHYTKIDTMKKIIDSHKIRFTRLDLLNDPCEGIVQFTDVTRHLNINQKVIYCSCWTSEISENLVLWAIYTQMKGVRLKMRSDLFDHGWKKFAFREIRNEFIPVSKIDSMPFTDKELKGGIQEIEGPIRIAYVRDLKELYQDAVDVHIANEGKADAFRMYDISLYELGIKKLDHWKYENEWRYRICPYRRISGGKKAFEQSVDFPTPEYIDVPFESEIEEIVVGPNVPDEQIEGIRSFLSIKKIDIPISKSSIEINIKDKN